eukprot:jgi/Chlat1/1469/Chrsp12S02016
MVTCRVLWAMVGDNHENVGDNWNVMLRVPVDGPQALLSAIQRDASALGQDLRYGVFRLRKEGMGWLTLDDSMTQADFLELWSDCSTMHVKIIVLQRDSVPLAEFSSYATCCRKFKQDQIVHAVTAIHDRDHEHRQEFNEFWTAHYEAVQALQANIPHVEHEGNAAQNLQVYEKIAELIQNIIIITDQAAYAGRQHTPPGGHVHCDRTGADGRRPDIAWCGYGDEAVESGNLHTHVRLLVEYKANIRTGTACNRGLDQLISGWSAACDARGIRRLVLPCAVLDSTHIIGVLLGTTNNGRATMTRTQTPLRYARDEAQGTHTIDPTSKGYKELAYCCYMANVMLLEASGASGCTLLDDHQPIVVRSAEQTYSFRIVARLGLPQALGTVYAVEALAGTQVSVPSPTCKYVLKVAPRPRDLEAARRLHLSLGSWTQVDREVAVLRHLGRHGVPCIPQLVDDGMLEAPAYAPDMEGARTIITPLMGRPLVQHEAISLPILGPAAVQTLAEDILEGLAFLHLRDILHNDVCPQNVGVMEGGSHDTSSSPHRYYLFDLGATSCRALHLADQPLGHSLYASTEWLLTREASSSLADVESLLYTCMALSSPAPLPWEEAVHSGDLLLVSLHRTSLYMHPEENAVQSWPRLLRNVALGIFGCMAAGTVPPPTDQWLHMLRGDSQHQAKRVRADGAEANDTCVAAAGESFTRLATPQVQAS